MRTFLGLTKPSEALEAMVKGLLKADKRKTFKIDMRTFGQSIDGICFGCAATCTLQEASKHNFKPDEILCEKERSEAIKANRLDLHNFECYMDDARRGHFYYLFAFFDIPYSFEFDHRFYLNNNWKNKLPEVRKVIKEMKKIGA